MKDELMKLDSAAVKLECITQTFMALNCLNENGPDELGSAALTVPCCVLLDISEEITALVAALFPKH